MAMTEQEKLDRMISEKRHQALLESTGKTTFEVTDAINKLSKNLVKQNEDSTQMLIEAVMGNAREISLFTGAIKNLPAPEINLAAPELPVVNIETNQEKVVASLGQIGNSINEKQDRIIALLEQSLRPKKYEFTLEKEPGPLGRIKKVLVKQIF